MHQVSSDLSKARREPFFDVLADWDHRDCPTGDNLQEKVFVWLLAPDPWKNHHAACESRHRGTAAWFIQGNMFWNGERVTGRWES